MIGKFSLCTLMLFGSLSLSAQDTYTLEATKDTYINSVIPNKTQGHVQSMIAAGWTYQGRYGKGRSLIGFSLDQLPENSKIISAKIELYYDYSAHHAGHSKNGLNSARLYVVNDDWNENTTWNTQPSFEKDQFAPIPASGAHTKDYSIDVTELVQNQMKSDDEISFLLKLNSERTYRSLVFASKEHEDSKVHPKLIITCESIQTPEPELTCYDNVTIPNVFTPNADNFNDEFEIRVQCEPTSFEINIYNRWGELVYSSTDKDFSWDGKDKDGNLVKTGTYFYSISYSDKQADYEPRNGYLSIFGS